MAPIVVTSVGVSLQVIDDPELQSFLHRLKDIAYRGGKETTPLSTDSDTGDTFVAAATAANLVSVDLDALTTELKRFQKWRFQEQVRIHVSYDDSNHVSCMNGVQFFGNIIIDSLFHAHFS